MEILPCNAIAISAKTSLLAKLVTVLCPLWRCGFLVVAASPEAIGSGYFLGESGASEGGPILSGGARGHLRGAHLHWGTMLKMVWHRHHHRHSRHVNEVGQKEEQARFAFQV